MSNTVRITSIVLIAFMAHLVLGEYFRPIRDVVESVVPSRLWSYVITYLIVGIPVFMGTMIIHRRFNILPALGLQSGLVKAFALAFLFTIPMFLGGLIFFSFNKELTLSYALRATVFAGLFEEVFFRGFLFGQLFRYTRLGFIPSIFFGAVLFASAHLYQSTDPGVLAGVFLMTFLGALLFAWIYVEWHYNLWLAVFMHALMNLSWALFAVSDHALGDVPANIGRVLTVALAITCTVVYKRRKGLTFEVNRRTLWWRKESAA